MRNILSFIFLLNLGIGFAQITLTHNIGTTPIDTGMPSCEEDESWARVFKLSDFGLDTSEQFIIRSAQVGISKSYNGAYLGLSVYSIDSDFPNSPPRQLGAGGFGILPSIDTPQVIQIDLTTPIIVPSGVEMILVEIVKFVDFYNPNSAEVIIAGTASDNDFSWYKGCREYYTHTSTLDLSVPVPNANFYINVTGEPFNTINTGTNTTLTHNLNDPPIWMNQYSCTGGGLKFARTFVLKDFGVSIDEEYIIDKGEVAFSAAQWDTKIQFNIYKIDSNFPDSFSSADLLGSSQIVDIPYFDDRITPRIFIVDFINPVVVPANVEMILVEVYNLPRPGYSSAAFIAGSEQSNDLSWLKSENGGCAPECYTSTVDMGKPEVNFYVKVSGDVNQKSNIFGMSITNICSEFLKEFSVENKFEVASVSWNFGDPTSGINNISNDLSPFHDFSSDGSFTVTATVTANDGRIEVLTEIIDVRQPPTAYGINNIYACEDSFNSGFSTSFDVSAIEQQVLNGQTDKTILYFDESGHKYYSLPNPFSNRIKGRETITVRVSDRGNLCCYSETTFDLIVNSNNLNIDNVEDLEVCDDDFDGFTVFDLTQTESEIKNGNSDLVVEFYHQDGELINSLNTVNRVVNQETVIGKVTNINTNCSNEITFNLIVIPLPTANILSEIIGCDDNNDGISEYFDTSNIESQVLGNQTGLQVSYFDYNGNPLPSPLPNPYTNTIPNEELIIVRVTNPITTCFSETSVTLKTASQPQIDQPQTLYSCDLGNGFANFDLSHIETEIIGNQNGLKITYFDSGNNQLPSPLSAIFQNTQAWSQTIYVRVENELNSLCYSETSFNLIVNQLPLVSMEDSYFLCNLETSLGVSVESDFDTYNWEYQDGAIISNTYQANLINAGNYTLTVGQNNNGIYCEMSFDFKLIRSELPSIVNVEYQELSNDNYIKINASGDGDFEYSIDGINYQSSNFFNNVLGGIYTVSVRDALGCGEDFEEVIIIDYPKYFTPNGDGVNDTWQIKGIIDYPNAEIFIYDRYGKFLKQISPNSNGWDGTFNGEKMLSSDYWFTVKLDDKNEFNGHFSLKR
ncbi:T9SS type B sorting domain-containing protein [Gaetbulibacter sp. M235]|uniref:T9SS type B sorting domain-containing protein n=1 Tax=Gaetbulibacter sp. M235 TaxID=3126510 RepID=UPI00374F3C41